MILSESFRPFKSRIRLLMIFDGFFRGVLCAGVLGVVWGILDWRGVAYLEWQQLVFLVACCGVIGSIVRLIRMPSEAQIASSIDRRAGLKDRLSTVAEVSPDSHSAFGDALRIDAVGALSDKRAKQIYPIRLQKFHLVGIGLVILAFLTLLLSNSNLFLSEDRVSEKAAMKKEAARLENLRKAIFDEPAKEAKTPEELQALEKDLQKLQKELEKAKMDPKEALVKAEELSKKADELAQEMSKENLDQLKDAESMLEKMQKAALEEAGLEKADFNDVKMSQADFDQKEKALEKAANDAQKKADELQKKLDDLQKKMNQPGLDPSAKDALQKQMEATQKQLDDAKKAAAAAKKGLEGMQLSKEARKALDAIMNDPLMKEIQKEMERLQKNAKAGQKPGEQPKLSKEEIEEMRKKYEEFLKQFEDDEFRKEYLKKILEALKKAKEMGQCKQCMGIMPGMIPGGGTGPGPDNDTMLFDTKKNNLSDPIQGKGKGKATFAPTERDDTRPGMEMTYEIKAPTFKGSRTSVPYKNVLPTYTKKAESALNKNDIPKDRQDQVKRYFESLKK